MVKPAMAYLDVVPRGCRDLAGPGGGLSGVRRVRDDQRCRGQRLDRPPCRRLESLTAIRRAGADIVLTYWAAEATHWLEAAGVAEVTGRPDVTRPADVDTGFWLWLTALPLLMIGQISEGFVAEVPGDRKMVVVATTFFTVGLGVIVLTFLPADAFRLQVVPHPAHPCGEVATIVYTAVTLLGVVP